MPPHSARSGYGWSMRPVRALLVISCAAAAGAVLARPVAAAPALLALRQGSSSAAADASASSEEPHTSSSGGWIPDAWYRAALASIMSVDIVTPYGSAFATGQPESVTESWLTHWLTMGGEGQVTVNLDDRNLTLPHRPAAFPDYLSDEDNLPVKGMLVHFTSLPAPKTQDADSAAPLEQDPAARDTLSSSPPQSSTDAGSEAHYAALPSTPERACEPRPFPPRRHPERLRPYRVALVERGGCDFAAKVLAAQDRGASAVVVGDSVARAGETDAEGRHRENLITMFSPENTEGIGIPSVFVSRASYLLLRDLLANTTVHGHPGVWVELGEAEDDGNALGSLLTFALLMPSLFLLATVAAHRVRTARQREANRAPPTVVLSLPERVWTPDIVWEKEDSDDSDKDTPEVPAKSPKADDAAKAAPDAAPPATEATEPVTDVAVTSADDADAETESPVAVKPPRRRGKERRKSKRYYGKDECAICMDNFLRGEIVRILPCGHVFHKDECDEWLLKWRKLCPTCRADVTVTSTDLSSSTTLTPVVERTPVIVPGGSTYGATPGNTVINNDANAGADDSDWGIWAWRDRLGEWGARVGAAGRSMGDSLRAAVSRPAPEAGDERTPLVAPGV